MEKTITVGSQQIRFKATASTPLRYRERTGRDLLKDLFSLTGAADKNAGTIDFSKLDSEILQQLAYTMAKQANPDLPEYMDWLDEFEPFEIITACSDILTLWGMSQTPTTKSKKK